MPRVRILLNIKDFVIVFIIRNHIQGVKTGSAERTFTNGDKLEFHYKDGMADGIWKIFYNLLFSPNYFPFFEGPATLTSEKSREEFNFLNGKKEGLSIFYGENGNKEERFYVNGILEGKFDQKFII